MLQKKNKGKTCDTSYIVLLWFSFTKYDGKIRNLSLRKMMTRYCNQVKVLWFIIVLR